MTDESICAGCAELIRVRTKRFGYSTSAMRCICSVEGLRDFIQHDETVEECSRFVEVPGERITKSDAADGSTGRYPQEEAKIPPTDPGRLTRIEEA